MLKYFGFFLNLSNKNIFSSILVFIFNMFKNDLTYWICVCICQCVSVCLIMMQLMQLTGYVFECVCVSVCLSILQSRYFINYLIFVFKDPWYFFLSFFFCNICSWTTHCSELGGQWNALATTARIASQMPWPLCHLHIYTQELTHNLSFSQVKGIKVSSVGVDNVIFLPDADFQEHYRWGWGIAISAYQLIYVGKDKWYIDRLGLELMALICYALLYLRIHLGWLHS